MAAWQQKENVRSAARECTEFSGRNNCAKYFAVKEGGRLLIDSKKLALRIAKVAKSKKAQKVVVLDMRAVSGFCDYFVILSGTSLKQVHAFAEAIEEDL